MDRHRKEGYLLNDNRANGGGLFEAATARCSHCHRVVVLNPDRIRERGFCRKCDSYLCDTCAAVGECQPFDKKLDQLLTATIHQEISSKI